MLAFTNRFLAIANLIRSLHKTYMDSMEQEILVEQIANLRKRLSLIKNMQLFGIISFLLCVVCMYLLFRGYTDAANWVFVGSMGALLVALALSLIEIQISTKALNLELKDMEEVFDKRSGLDFIFKKDSKKNE